MIRSKTEKRPAEIAARLPEGQVFMTLGKEYEVYALSVFEGRVNVQIIDDLRIIHWYPAWYFEMLDTLIPSDWICNICDGQPSMLIGPPFLAESLDSYASMVQLESDPVQKFWRRLDEQKEKEALE